MSKEKLNHHGSLEELKGKVAADGFEGSWAEEGEAFVFRGADLTVTWFHKAARKTVQIQGKGDQAKMRACIVNQAQVVELKREPNKRTGASRAKVFIVHGHDRAAREQLELIVRRLGLDPFVLQNSSGGSRTIIEALEHEILKDAPKFGIVLMTPDDIGYAKDKLEQAKPRARQNVVLEMGMLLARLSRSHVAILRKGDLELPSDASGILYLRFEESVEEVASALAGHLIDAGFDLDPANVAAVGRR